MKATIVFKINVNTEESCGKLANFIYKRENHLNMESEETDSVRYKYYMNEAYNDGISNEWMKKIYQDDAVFGCVNEPGKIKNITSEYEVVYCIVISNKMEIVNISNIFLIKHFYSKLNIILFFEKCSNENYFRTSQFLYSVNQKYSSFYENCFFENDQKIKKAQKSNIRFSKKFIPLQIIDKENLGRLFQKINKILNRDQIGELILGSKKADAIPEELIIGSIKLLKESRKIPEKDQIETVVNLIENLDILSFVMLCCTICSKDRENTFEKLTLQKYIYEIQQYAGAVRQLAENIVYHSKTGCGTLTLRIHAENSDYIKTQYGIPEKNKDIFLEISISDFCGDELRENIAQNFVKSIKDEIVQKEFKELCPASFFVHKKEDSVEKAWNNFYKNPENIGKHFGLKIFQNIVTTFDGLFGAESHADYISKQGDCYFSYNGIEKRYCMPGTQYHIVFPLLRFRDVIRRQDMSLDSGLSMGQSIRQILRYTTKQKDIIWQRTVSETQDEKNSQIKILAGKIQKLLSKENRCDIMYFPMDKVANEEGEIFAKALVIALYFFSRDLTIVLYQCTERQKRDIYNTLKVFFCSDAIEPMFLEKKNQIVLYSRDYGETVIDLASAHNTDNINTYISYMKCINMDEYYIRRDDEEVDIEKGAQTYIPCDILQEVKIDNKCQTIFEHYAEAILQKNIQEKEFGCKLEHTHMRLGSTIHIGDFYEAEILFGNKLFVSRFAVLLVKDMISSLNNVSKLTLYGYGTYSETVLVQMVEMIRGYYNNTINVDYIILEREEERRGFLHKDRIRYNQIFASEQERKKYFKDRKIVTVVLINSTLKTHIRLIKLFQDENDMQADGSWLLKNYAVLLVGNEEKNQYWKLAKGKTIKHTKERINPDPRYFIQLPVEYQEPRGCEYCFPENPISEIPLIEVNAASTIPNQAFGIRNLKMQVKKEITYNHIKETENKLKCLKGQFIYNHVQRNENHFLYYFRTEDIWIREKDNIRESLGNWKRLRNMDSKSQYHIIVSPMHYSNAGFIELVNDTVFEGNAILLRIDFDKEYRCNAYAKFSYLRNYIWQLRQMNIQGSIHVHYVDDVIVSGRTYHRAKSLVKTVLREEGISKEKVDIDIFDKVFVLIDRNSADSRKQYVKKAEDFYSFIDINISSLRNYGDSCVFCNLEKESTLLYDTAATELMSQYWERTSEKFRLYSLEEYNETLLKKQRKPVDIDRAFRRLFCTHMAQDLLRENAYQNDTLKAICLILDLLNIDYVNRKKERVTEHREISEKEEFEYFLSYLKCISRPFLVFRKAVKEAIFDILLLLLDATVKRKNVADIIDEADIKGKDYLREDIVKERFDELDKNILKDPDLRKEDRQELVKLLMKQLTELKSNYIIREEKMDAIYAFMKEEDEKEFQVYYMTLIERLVGASSDTNKSVWLEEMIMKSSFTDVPLEFQEWIIIENTRAFRDGIEKLYIMWNISPKFRELSNERIKYLRQEYDCHRAIRMFDDFLSRNNEEFEKYEEIIGSDKEREVICQIENKIEHFIESLPLLSILNLKSYTKALRRCNNNLVAVLKKTEKVLKTEMDVISRNSEDEELMNNLQQIIKDEADAYQYANFYRILDNTDYMERGELSQKGVDMIICCMKVLYLCRNKDEGILEKVRELAVLFRVILDASKVQFIVENESDRYLDRWKYDVVEKFSELVTEWNESNESKLDNISIEKSNHYMVLVEKTGNSDYNIEVSEDTEEILERLEKKDAFENNYIIDNEKGIVLWRINSQQRTIWINIEKEEWKRENRLRIARDMRMVMIFYQELRKEIFNTENDYFMDKISNAQRKLNIYNSNKVFTHTKEFPQVIQYNQVKNYLENATRENADLQIYPYYVLNLLTDLNVSRYYRRGLREPLYDELDTNNLGQWKEVGELLKNERDFIYEAEPGEQVNLQLVVDTDIKEADHILCRGNNPDSIREFTLLLYALILNAAEKGRGVRENLVKSTEETIQNVKYNVIVEVKREGEYLIIQNESSQNVNIDEIRRKLKKVPESSEDGISLWSANVYIQRCNSSLAIAMINRTKEKLLSNQVTYQELEELKKKVDVLLNEKGGVKIDNITKNDRHYFTIALPIFTDI